MSRTRALFAAAAAMAVAGVLAAPAAAGRPTFDAAVTTSHFVVHYDTNAALASYSTQTDAGDIAGYAEAAYSLYTSWGYTPPPNSPDGHIDIYIQDLSGPPAEEAIFNWDTPATSPDTGYVQLATPTQLKGFGTSAGYTVPQVEQIETSAGVFMMFEFGTWVPLTTSDQWLALGAAQWAGMAASGYPNAATSIGTPAIALDCHDAIGGHNPCDPTDYLNGGDARWAFFQLLANEYGNTFIHSALVNAQAGQSATTALSNALVAKGSSLAIQFNNYASNLLTGNIGLTGVTADSPDADQTITTGAKSGTDAPVAVTPTDHLAARYVTFQRGDGDGSHACFAATLSISVAMPAGTMSEPSFYWAGGSGGSQPLTVNGNTASITVPWDTCDWGTTSGWLSLPNAGTTTDGAVFVVSSSISVDTTTPASAGAPPAQVPVWGTPIPVPTTDVAPTIDAFGPELLRLSASSPVIRLIVESSGPGNVNAALGTKLLGTRGLRAGNNDLRFVVPASLLKALRQTATAANLLTLTPTSPSGAVSGVMVTRKVSIAAPPKPAKRTK
ncbi:MAG: hypothetical protein JOY72_10285 [Actinobacteria bacterium]|nr:hypothetical protein [Actinomycetota bacterium]